MAWDDAQAILERLRGVLNEFDWAAADGIVDELLSRLKREQTPFPADMGRRFASELRRKRRFKTSERFAEALLLAGVTDPQVRRRYCSRLSSIRVRMLRRMTSSAGCCRVFRMIIRSGPKRTDCVAGFLNSYT